MKNIRKFNLKKSLALVIILFILLIINPFISNDYSFIFFKTIKYWAMVVPMMLIILFYIYIIIEEDKNSSGK